MPLIHEFGVVGPGLRCRSCRHLTRWRCFTCGKALCYDCLLTHVGRNGSYNGKRLNL